MSKVASVLLHFSSVQRVYDIDRSVGLSLCLAPIRPVILQPDHLPPIKHATEHNHYILLPFRFTAVGGPVVSLEPTETDQLSLKYSSGTKCKQNAALNVSSIIQLKCNSKQIGKISYVRQSNCTHFFEWPTPVACLTQPPSCTAYDATNNFNFDLRPLKGRSYNVSRDGRTYNFGVCQSPKTCGNEAVGSCNAQQVMFGKVNDALTYDAATGAPPFLVYTGGAKCATQEGDGYTKIEFVCPATDRDEDDDKAELVDDKNCIVVIRFATQLACPQKILCKDTFKGVDYDLTPLMNGQGNYEATLAEELKNSSYKGSKVSLRSSFSDRVIITKCLPSTAAVLFERVPSAGGPIWTQLPPPVGGVPG